MCKISILGLNFDQMLVSTKLGSVRADAQNVSGVETKFMCRTIEQFEARMRRLEILACPTSADSEFFNKCMERADELCLNYREALEYTICMRNGGSD